MRARDSKWLKIKNTKSSKHFSSMPKMMFVCELCGHVGNTFACKCSLSKDKTNPVTIKTEISNELMDCQKNGDNRNENWFDTFFEQEETEINGNNDGDSDRGRNGDSMSMTQYYLQNFVSRDPTQLQRYSAFPALESVCNYKGNASALTGTPQIQSSQFQKPRVRSASNVNVQEKHIDSDRKTSSNADYGGASSSRLTSRHVLATTNVNAYGKEKVYPSLNSRPLNKATDSSNGWSNIACTCVDDRFTTAPNIDQSRTSGVPSSRTTYQPYEARNGGPPYDSVDLYDERFRGNRYKCGSANEGNNLDSFSELPVRRNNASPYNSYFLRNENTAETMPFYSRNGVGMTAGYCSSQNGVQRKRAMLRCMAAYKAKVSRMSYPRHPENAYATNAPNLRGFDLSMPDSEHSHNQSQRYNLQNSSKVVQRNSQQLCRPLKNRFITQQPLYLNLNDCTVKTITRSHQTMVPRRNSSSAITDSVYCRNNGGQPPIPNAIGFSRSGTWPQPKKNTVLNRSFEKFPTNGHILTKTIVESTTDSATKSLKNLGQEKAKDKVSGGTRLSDNGVWKNSQLNNMFQNISTNCIQTFDSTNCIQTFDNNVALDYSLGKKNKDTLVLQACKSHKSTLSDANERGRNQINDCKEPEKDPYCSIGKSDIKSDRNVKKKNGGKIKELRRQKCVTRLGHLLGHAQSSIIQKRSCVADLGNCLHDLIGNKHVSNKKQNDFSSDFSLPEGKLVIDCNFERNTNKDVSAQSEPHKGNSEMNEKDENVRDGNAAAARKQCKNTQRNHKNDSVQGSLETKIEQPLSDPVSGNQLNVRKLKSNYRNVEKCPTSENDCTSTTDVSRIEEHFDLKHFPCSICGLSIPTPQMLAKHLSLHYSRKFLPCAFCDAVLKNRTKFWAHVQSDHLDIPDATGFSVNVLEGAAEYRQVVRKRKQILKGTSTTKHTSTYKPRPGETQCTSEVDQINHADETVQSKMDTISEETVTFNKHWKNNNSEASPICNGEGIEDAQGKLVSLHKDCPVTQMFSDGSGSIYHVVVADSTIASLYKKKFKFILPKLLPKKQNLHC